MTTKIYEINSIIMLLINICLLKATVLFAAISNRMLFSLNDAPRTAYDWNKFSESRQKSERPDIQNSVRQETQKLCMK